MAAEKNIVRTSVATTTLGGAKPLTSVSTYLNQWGEGKPLEITAEVRQGNTTHKVEINLTQDAARDLARDILAKLPSEEGDES